MLDQNQIDQLQGKEAYGSDGEKIGKVGAVYLDDQTGRPEWVTVNTGLFGMNESFVPLQNASVAGDHLQLPYDKSTVKDAPNVSADGHLSPDEERSLYRHYGVSYDEYDGQVSPTSDDSTYSTTGTAGTESTYSTTRSDDSSYATGTDTSSSSDDAMTRSEERLNVGTESQETGRARLRKYVVTENVTETVPVRKEKAVLEREPITSDNKGDATSGPEISEAEHEVTLSEERPVVSKTTEPVERVRLSTEETTDQETVSEDVRKERIEAEGDVSGNEGTGRV